jgi:hypothetical protein
MQILQGDSKNRIFKALNECNVLFFFPLLSASIRQYSDAYDSNKNFFPMQSGLTQPFEKLNAKPYYCKGSAITDTALHVSPAANPLIFPLIFSRSAFFTAASCFLPCQSDIENYAAGLMLNVVFPQADC